MQVLTVGENTYKFNCRGEQSNDHTVCAVDKDWAQGRAQEVGVVKMRGEVQVRIPPRYCLVQVCRRM